MVAPSWVMLCCAQYEPPAMRPPMEVGMVVSVDHCLRRLRMARYSLQVIGSLPLALLSGSEAEDEAKRCATTPEAARGARVRASVRVEAERRDMVGW